MRIRVRDLWMCERCSTLCVRGLKQDEAAGSSKDQGGIDRNQAARYHQPAASSPPPALISTRTPEAPDRYIHPSRHHLLFPPRPSSSAGKITQDGVLARRLGLTVWLRRAVSPTRARPPRPPRAGPQVLLLSLPATLRPLSPSSHSSSLPRVPSRTSALPPLLTFTGALGRAALDQPPPYTVGDCDFTSAPGYGPNTLFCDAATSLRSEDVEVPPRAPCELSCGVLFGRVRSAGRSSHTRGPVGFAHMQWSSFLPFIRSRQVCALPALPFLPLRRPFPPYSHTICPSSSRDDPFFIILFIFLYPERASTGSSATPVSRLRLPHPTRCSYERRVGSR
ncbi:hypothetical protein B0H17DRAFT_1206255 [Mycena rosella]|uniref:Uncharacterized protein n=1 Tax=Mycena rosella TaxID=1033263 RepID=A0AAD7D5G7_MYCRO|nr:hypothetical protein B0H17DRAFT_1206255 [Mycena rosella]